MQSNRAGEIDESSHIVEAAPIPLSQEDQARADFYALIARLLIAAPDEHLLSALASADSLSSQQVDHPLDLAWEKLVLTASIMDPVTVREEFNELFISVGTPQVNPYASLYLAGFMNEKPLAALRDDLAQLGFTRAPGIGEPEDHLAALCETMRLLIGGGFGAKRSPLSQQKIFYEKHIGCWVERCLDDIAKANGANFYRQVANFARAFFTVESEAFEIEEAMADESASMEWRNEDKNI